MSDLKYHTKLAELTNWVGQKISFFENVKGEDYPVLIVIEGKEFSSSQYPDLENMTSIDSYCPILINGTIMFRCDFLNVKEAKEAWLIGDLEGLPIRVVNEMLSEQKDQTGTFDITIFQEDINKGFFWDESSVQVEEPWDFWHETLISKNFEWFDEVLYPEENWKKEGALNEQIDLQRQLNNQGYNLITCGGCDQVLIHKKVELGQEEKSVNCPSCGNENFPSDCQDLYYEGMPENS